MLDNLDGEYSKELSLALSMSIPRHSGCVTYYLPLLARKVGSHLPEKLQMAARTV